MCCGCTASKAHSQYSCNQCAPMQHCCVLFAALFCVTFKANVGLPASKNKGNNKMRSETTATTTTRATRTRTATQTTQQKKSKGGGLAGGVRLVERERKGVHFRCVGMGIGLTSVCDQAIKQGCFYREEAKPHPCSTAQTEGA